jgi:hypothetical protein
MVITNDSHQLLQCPLVFRRTGLTGKLYAIAAPPGHAMRLTIRMIEFPPLNAPLPAKTGKE